MAFSTLDLLICSTCGVQYDVDAGLNSSKEKYHNVFTTYPENPNLIAIHTAPKLGIGQRAFLCLGGATTGNILWDCITYLDEETIRHVNSLGGISAIVISHPHYFSTSIQWAETFDCDLYISAEDEEWLGNRGDGTRMKLWNGQRLGFPCDKSDGNPDGSDIIAIKTGGHFPGSSVLWWKSAKKLFIADTIMLIPSGLYTVNRPPGTASFSFMWSYPNFIPLTPDAIHDIWKAIKDIHFEDAHGAFLGQDTRGNSKERILESAKIIIQASGYLQHPLLNEVYKIASS
ncbi:beta-lactamase-like protein [Penicillium herquei]|nr:beta-lactamase-like protein [Penicillium herquei]